MKIGKFRTLVALVELDHETGGRLLADLANGKGKAARKLRKMRREVEAHPLGKAMLEGMAAMAEKNAGRFHGQTPMIAVPKRGTAPEEAARMAAWLANAVPPSDLKH